MSIEYIINKILHLDPNLTQLLEQLANKSLSVTCSDFPSRTFYCLFSINHLEITSNKPDLEIDVKISGPLIGLLTLAVKKQSADFRSAKINVYGDLNSAELIQNLFFQLDLDWEEELSKYTGDVIAHQALSLLKNLRNYSKQSASSFEEMITEYLQEESGLLPTHCEVDAFMHDIDQLRLDVDRLEARIKLYESV